MCFIWSNLTEILVLSNAIEKLKSYSRNAFENVQLFLLLHNTSPRGTERHLWLRVLIPLKASISSCILYICFNVTLAFMVNFAASSMYYILTLLFSIKEIKVPNCLKSSDSFLFFFKHSFHFHRLKLNFNWYYINACVMISSNIPKWNPVLIRKPNEHS